MAGIEKSYTFAPLFGDSLAQQVEHIPFKDGVVGSSPTRITMAMALSSIGDGAVFCNMVIKQRGHCRVTTSPLFEWLGAEFLTQDECDDSVDVRNVDLAVSVHIGTFHGVVIIDDTQNDVDDSVQVSDIDLAV